MKGDKGDIGLKGDDCLNDTDSGIFIKFGNNGNTCMNYCLNSAKGPDVGSCIRGIHTTPNNAGGRPSVSFECNVPKTGYPTGVEGNQTAKCVCIK